MPTSGSENVAPSTAIRKSQASVISSPPAESEAVHGGDSRDLQPGEPPDEGVQGPVVRPPLVRVHRGTLLEVHPRTEGPPSRTGQDHYPGLPGGLHLVERLSKLLDHAGP
jgi:hypothetical protein